MTRIRLAQCADGSKLTGEPEANKNPQGSGDKLMSLFSEEDLIFSFSTKDAVEEGSLVKVDQKILKEAGIKLPVYLTRAVWDKYVEVPDVPNAGQSIDGRLWDVLYMFLFAARACSGNMLTYQLNVVLADKGDWEPNEKLDPDMNGDRTMRLITLKAVMQAQDFDDPSPAIFIMKPSED